MILFCLGLLMTFTAGATKSSDASVLRIDSVHIDGNMMDEMVQHLCIYGRNTSDQDFEGLLFVVQDIGNGQYKRQMALSVSVGAGSCMEHADDLILKQGEYDLCMAADEKGENLLGGSCHVTIGPLRPIDFSVKFFTEMMTTVNGENTLSGHRLQGRLELTNNDTVPYYGIAPYLSQAQGIDYHLSEANTGRNVSFRKFIVNEVEIGQTVSYDFAIDCDFEEGKRYSLVLNYAQPHDIVRIKDSLTFTFHAGTNTYWTADGTVKPVPVEANQRLVVPAEAVAVDLRGQYYMNTAFTIEISQANPNCLYYLDFLDNVPQGLNDQCNVVRDKEAAIIRLTDNYDFRCPKSFKTQFISYTLNPNTANGAYAETLVLPFQPQGASIDHINRPGENLLKVFEYDGFNADTDTIGIHEINVNQMKANKPYITAVGVCSPVTFYAEETTVPVTTQAVTQSVGFDLVGGTVFQSPKETPPYRYEPSKGVFVVQDTGERLPPFRAWFYKRDNEASSPDGTFQYLRMNTGFDIGASEDNQQGISSAAVGRDTPPAYYSLSGMRHSADHLAKGLYIVDGKKVIIK